MAQKYYNVAEAAKILGRTPAEINEMVLHRDLYGYRDGADWKFKVEDIDRVAAERGHGGEDDDSDNVLASEVELGQSDPGMSGTVIGPDQGAAHGESDILLSASDVKLAGTKPGETNVTGGGSEFDLLDSTFNMAGSAPSSAKPNETSAGSARFDNLDMTLDHDLTLQDSSVSTSPVKAAAPAKTTAPAKAAAAPAPPATGESVVDLGGKKLDDDDMVLGGSGAGSDISIGGDSGISLVDPADSGLSLETPLNLSKDEESLELGEDDLLGLSSGPDSVVGMKSEDDFQLTPMEDLSDSEDSESGSQVIALDTEGDDSQTMVASSAPVGLLDDDLGAEPSLAAMPMTSAATELGLAGPEDSLAAGGAAAVLPEAPYSIWNILSLVVISLLLMMVGMMMYELLRNMWGANQPIEPSKLDDWLMSTILNVFEK